MLRLPNGRFLAIKGDGNSAHASLDPYNGAAGCVAEACRNVVAVGAEPIALVDHLQFGDPSDPEVYWSFRECGQRDGRLLHGLRPPRRGREGQLLQRGLCDGTRDKASARSPWSSASSRTDAPRTDGLQANGRRGLVVGETTARAGRLRVRTGSSGASRRRRSSPQGGRRADRQDALPRHPQADRQGSGGRRPRLLERGPRGRPRRDVRSRAALGAKVDLSRSPPRTAAAAPWTSSSSQSRTGGSSCQARTREAIALLARCAGVPHAARGAVGGRARCRSMAGEQPRRELSTSRRCEGDGRTRYRRLMD